MTSFDIRGQIALLQDEVQVWCANLDGRAANEELLFESLSREEKERAGRFVLAIDRSRFVAARGILRKLLGGYLHQSPTNVCIETARQGKPTVCNALGASEARLRFNLSHSYGLALYAFSLEREVGIDIEKIMPEFEKEDLAERYFSKQEREDLRVMPRELRSEAFFRCWTRKEAYLKARGAGLYIPLDSFTVSLKQGEPAVLTSSDSENWKLYSLPPRPGFAAALVVEGPQCRVAYSEWE
jgi:4'-phosphopantetheinyl transferase